MAIYDHKYGELSYYRVYRAWGGKEYQEYVRIPDGKGKAAAYKEAQAIDERLANEQQAFTKAKSQTAKFHVRKDGSIKGLRRVTLTRKGRAPVEVLELRINVPWESQVKRTTISIAVHGEEAAFAMAIDKIAEWYELEQTSEAYQAMQASSDFYLKDGRANVAEIALQRAKNELETLTGGLVSRLKRFTA